MFFGKVYSGNSFEITQECGEPLLDGFGGNKHSKMPKIFAEIFLCVCFWAAIMDLVTALKY